MVYETVVRRPDPRRPGSWCREGAAHDHRACGSLWDSTSQRDIEEAARWADENGPRERLEAKAAELRAAGYVVLAPQLADGSPTYSDAEAADLRRLFEMQWERMTEATERWRAEDPEARSLIMPDLGALLRWLMDQADMTNRA